MELHVFPSSICQSLASEIVLIVEDHCHCFSSLIGHCPSQFLAFHLSRLEDVAVGDIGIVVARGSVFVSLPFNLQLVKYP